MEEVPERKPDTVQLLSTFPEEIWIIIFEKMHDVEDYFHLCKASLYFEKLLKLLRVHILFPEVAKVLKPHLQKYPQVLRQVMTKSRTVCRTWQKGVDAVLHNVQHCYKLKDAEGLGIIPSHPFEFYYEYFRTLEHVESFRRRFDETHAGTNRNPFVCRRVKIEYGSRIGPDWEYILEIEPLLELLREYGHQIWHCMLLVCSIDRLGTALSHYQHLREMLELMPNLKTLTLSCSYLDLSELDLEDVELQVEAHPFPKLKHLVYIHFFRAPTPIIHGLLKPNGHVKMLGLVSWNSRGNNILCQETLPELEQLSILLQRERQFQQLQRLTFVWPLKKLSASVTESIRVADLFALMKNKWGESLTELTLFLSGGLEMPALELPKLEAFTLETEFFTPLDFLLACKLSLSSLTVYVKIDDSDVEYQTRLQSALDNERAVRFYGFRDNLVNSNIWTQLPKLRSVKYNDWELILERRQKPATRRFDWMLKQLENA